MTFTLTYWRSYLRQATFYDSTKGLFIDRYYLYGSDAFVTWPPQLDSTYPSLPVARTTPPPSWSEPLIVTPPPPPPVAGSTPSISRLLAGSNITGGKVIALRADGVHMADRLVDAHKIIGISKGSAMAGDYAEIATGDQITEAGWSWVQGAPVILGATPGELTQSEPADWYIPVASAVTPNKLWVRVDQPIKLIP